MTNEKLIEQLRELSLHVAPNIYAFLNEAADVIESYEQKPRKQRKFKPPTREEVRAYVQSRNSTVDPDYFYDYFTTGEWIDSEGKQVRNWKQKLLTWEGRGDNGRKQHLANGQSSAETGKAKSKFVYDNA
jgi:hypothetical protein